MVYCTKCGFKNEDDAKVCTQCGASLHMPREGRRRSANGCFGTHKGRPEDECFGLPYGGAIAGIIFGLIIVIVGISIILEESIWQYFWPILIIVFGILVIAGALYGLQRRY